MLHQCWSTINHWHWWDGIWSSRLALLSGWVSETINIQKFRNDLAECQSKSRQDLFLSMLVYCMSGYPLLLMNMHISAEIPAACERRMLLFSNTLLMTNESLWPARLCLQWQKLFDKFQWWLSPVSDWRFGTCELVDFWWMWPMNLSCTHTAMVIKHLRKTPGTRGFWFLHIRLL